MVVFAVAGEHLGHEAAFGVGECEDGVRDGGCGRGGGAGRKEGKEGVEEEMSVVPDLVVLFVFKGHGVGPVDFGVDGFGEGFTGCGGGRVGRGCVDGEEGGGAVEPDGVVGGVHFYDVLGEREDARGMFVVCHYGAEVGHSYCRRSKSVPDLARSRHIHSKRVARHENQIKV